MIGYDDYAEEKKIDDCDNCKHGKMLGSYTEKNNWCNYHKRQCNPFKYKCENHKINNMED